MSGYSIDDVKEVFSADVATYVAQMAGLNEALMNSPLLQGEEVRRLGELRPFEKLAEVGHGFRGTASLVAATNTAAGADWYEKLALRGHEALELARLHTARAARFAAKCKELATELRCLAEHDIRHEDNEAELTLMSIEGAIAELIEADDAALRSPSAFLGDPPPAEKSGSLAPSEDKPAEVAAESVERKVRDTATTTRPNGGAHGNGGAVRKTNRPSQAPPGLAAMAVGPEDELHKASALVDIFRVEVEEHRAAVVAGLRAISKNPSDQDGVRTLYHAFHTIKGAAATVGLTQVASLAKKLHVRAEQWLESGGAVSPDELVELFQLTDELLEGAGCARVIPELAPALDIPARPRPSSQAKEGNGAESALPAELADFFKEEARELLVALQGHLKTLSERFDDRNALEHAERLLHTLKGAAATVGEDATRKLAGDLQDAVERIVEGQEEPSAEFVVQLTEQVKKILARVGLENLNVVAGPEADEAKMSGLDVFREEAKSLMQKAGALGQELRGASPSRAREIRDALRVLFHRLKGSAAMLHEDRIRDAAANLELSCDGAERSDELADDVQRGVVIIKSLLPSQDAGAAASAEPRRSEVTIPEERELWEAVMQECTELLDSLDKVILGLEESTQPRDDLQAAARYIHTLKGALNTGGLSPTGREMHALEDFLEVLGASVMLPPLRHVASVLLLGQESARAALKDAPKGFVVDNLPRIERRISSMQRTGAPVAASDAPQAASGDSIERHIDPGQSQDSQASHGSQRSNASKSSRGHSGQMATEEQAERSFIRVNTERLDSLMNLAGELVVSRSRLLTRVTAMRALQEELGRSQSRLLGTVDSFRERYEFESLGGQGRVVHGPWKAKQFARALAPTGTESVTAKADDLAQIFSDIELDRYEDIHVLSRSLGEIGNDFDDINHQISSELASFVDDSDSFSKLVSDIQGEVTRSRMVTLELLFTRVQLPLRDAAQREGKDIRVVTSGAAVSIDKTIADALFAPLLHLVRNAVVHGIESPETRERGGKDRRGTVSLVASEQSGQIMIEVRDDGAGLDLRALHARGVSKGLIPANTPVDDPAVKQLVFAAGLSTKDAAGDVAGRGIGGDVVRRTIERLNGDIRLQTTQGKGTSFIVTLPLTLAITRALLVKQHGQTYAVPLHFCEHIYDTVDEGLLQHIGGVPRIRLEDGFMVVQSLGTPLSGSAGSGRGPVIMLRVGDHRMALQVEELVSQEEIVVKQLGDLLSGHPLFSGISIRGAGEIVLIVDVPGLVEAQGTRTVDPKAVRAREEVPHVVVEAAAEESPALPPVKLELTKTRILFVDDSLSARKVAEQFLQGPDVAVTTAVDGLDALAKLREGTFDIVFTDLEMPRMHGYDLIRSLRTTPSTQSLPIVVVSSRSAQKHQTQARQLGATDYLTKPFTAHALQAVIAEHVQKGK